MPEFIFHDPSGARVVRVPRWAMVLGAVGLTLVGALLLILAAGFALIVVPIALVGAGIAGWFARKRGRVLREEWVRAEGEAERGTVVIEGDYRIIEPRKQGD